MCAALNSAPRGRQPIEPGWRTAFSGWRPSEEKGEAAQELPVLRNGETARLLDPVIEDKETRPPPRYQEGTLIEAMQDAWRFVEDKILRERLKEARGIGTPATRAEVISGLRKQGFLSSQGKHIVPTARGLALFGALERADPALVDPGVTAQMECLLDDVLTGKQDMVAAIDAVCANAQRIIGRLVEGRAGALALAPEEVPGSDRGSGNSSGGGDERPPTAAMRRYAAALARRKGIKPPRGYTRSSAICRAFLEQHATGQAPREGAGKTPAQPSPAQLSYAEALARQQGIVIPDGGQSQCAGNVEVDRCEPEGENRQGPWQVIGQCLNTPLGFSPVCSTVPNRVGSGAGQEDQHQQERDAVCPQGALGQAVRATAPPRRGQNFSRLPMDGNLTMLVSAITKV